MANLRASSVGSGTSGFTARTANLAYQMGDLLMAVTSGIGAGATVTAGGWTFATVIDGLPSSNSVTSNCLSFYIVNEFIDTNASGVSTGSNSSAVICALSLYRLQNVVTVSGESILGSAAVRQMVTKQLGSSGEVPSLTFPADVLIGNMVIAMLVNQGSTGNVMVPPSGFTEICDTGEATPSTGLHVSYRTNGFSGRTISFGDVSATEYCAALVEINNPTYAAGAITGQALLTAESVRHPRLNGFQSLSSPSSRLREALSDPPQSTDLT